MSPGHFLPAHTGFLTVPFLHWFEYFNAANQKNDRFVLLEPASGAVAHTYGDGESRRDAAARLPANSSTTAVRTSRHPIWNQTLVVDVLQEDLDAGDGTVLVAVINLDSKRRIAQVPKTSVAFNCRLSLIYVAGCNSSTSASPHGAVQPRYKFACCQSWRY